ncbi:hypothetical protein BGZ82_003556, partial [Podila clonocystis]
MSGTVLIHTPQSTSHSSNSSSSNDELPEDVYEDSLCEQNLDEERLLEGSMDDQNLLELLQPAPLPLETDGGDTNIPKIHHWQEAIQQWDDGDPEHGLAIPLKEWSSLMRASNRNFHKRHVIVEEFEFFGRDKEKLQEYHGENTDGVDRLIQAIWRRREKEYHQFDKLDLRKSYGRVEANTNSNTKAHTDAIAKEGGSNDYSQEGESDEKTDGDNGCSDEVEQCIPRINHWKGAVPQWDKEDAKNGLTVPLSKWTFSMRKLHQDTFYPRRTIADEFEHFGHNEGKMRAIYGDDMRGPSKQLVMAIRRL